MTDSPSTEPTPAAAPPVQHFPTAVELDDLELLLAGTLAPMDRFAGPLRLVLPPEAAGEQGVDLVDPEGLPLARVAADGSLAGLARPAHGPFRRLHLTPAEAHHAHGHRAVVGVADALDDDQLAALAAERRPLLLLAFTGAGTATLSPTGLVRATLAAAEQLPDAAVVATPLAAHPWLDQSEESGLRHTVLTAYAGDASVVDPPPASSARRFAPRVAEVVAAERRTPAEVGLVLFFTGLSGSGKSTLARAVTDRLLELGGRAVTSLDGDVVRRMLSSGLGFSRADRETNIRRIGWVAAEIGRHGGLAVCSPIAPFAETRAQVREMAESAGADFFLVHVATPLEECERRDRKGLYARARRGEIPDFTGISSPYEEPEDAAVRLDTTGRTIEDCADEVWAALTEAGYLGTADGAGSED